MFRGYFLKSEIRHAEGRGQKLLSVLLLASAITNALWNTRYSNGFLGVYIECIFTESKFSKLPTRPKQENANFLLSPYK